MERDNALDDLPGGVVWRVWVPFTASELMPVAAIGTLSIAILGVLDLALEAAPASLLVPVLVLIPVWETILSIPLRGALPYTTQLAGMAVIAAGVVVWFGTRLLRADSAPSSVSGEAA